jgi:8-oxo-dGTP diphosphatase
MLSITLGTPAKDTTYERHTAVRCIVIKNDQICIIHVKKGMYTFLTETHGCSDTSIKGNCYKLPGGGVEPEDQNDEVACQREALEETGCEVIVRPHMVAHTTEYRGTLQQESHAYVCTVRNDTGKVELTDLEASEGLAHLWCPIAEALQEMKAIEPTTELGEFIQKRDVFLLETYLQT